MPSATQVTEQNGNAAPEGGHKFLVMERNDNNPHGMASVPPFCISKALEGIDDVKITLLRNDTMLFETQKITQVTHILALRKVGKIPVKVYEHPKLNKSRGVIKCKDIISCDPQDILENLEERNVVHIKQIKRHMTDTEHAKCLKERKQPTRKDTGIFVVTFNTPDLPKELKVGFVKSNVELYIPKPLRCFRCLRLGHAVVTCKEKLVKKEKKCVNCSGAHRSWSKDCPVYKRECTILQLKAVKKVSYGQAKVEIDFASIKAKAATENPQASTSSASRPITTASSSPIIKAAPAAKAPQQPKMSKNARKRAAKAGESSVSK